MMAIYCVLGFVVFVILFETLVVPYVERNDK